MAEPYLVPGLPETLGLEIAVRKVQRAVGGDGMPTLYDFICISARNIGSDKAYITLGLEGRRRDTGEVRKTRTITHGDWSLVSPGAKRSTDISPGGVNWFLTAVEVKRGEDSRRHEMSHQIAHHEPGGCGAKLIVPVLALALIGVLGSFLLG